MRVLFVGLGLFAVIVATGCARGVQRYTRTCDAVQAHYEEAGFDHLPEPDQTLMRAWVETRNESGIPRAKEVARLVRVFRDAEGAAERLEVARALLAAVSE